ncbi:glycosyltransferase [Methanobrevibacter sp. DSM 116169]|uniref:glycosyltransferase n=1 Tax=Methanobrevibacter sp. DSM 116169 TaxID=3242727 RepID=UPI0038FC4E30
MKILLVQESDWLERNPHQQHHLMDRMAIKGHEVVVIDYPIDWPKDKESNGFIYHSEIYEGVSKVDDSANIEVIRPGFIKITGLNYASLYFTHKKEIEKQINKFKPDVILSLGIMNAYTASRLAKKHNIPFVFYIIDVLYALIPEKAFQPLGEQLNKRTIKNADLVLTINDKLSEFAIKMGSTTDKTLKIDAGIDLKEFNPDLNCDNIKKECNFNDDDIILFFMGWIYDFSGMKELAIKLGENKEKYPNIKILIVGDGDSYDELLKIQEKYNLYNQLILTGKQPYSKIPEYLASADFCLLPAYIDEEIMQDIVPIKLYEYLAMKKVVIATELPGISKEFGYNNGVEYVQSADEVLDKVSSILDNNSYDGISSSGREYVKHNDWNLITDKFESTLNKLIDNY